MRVVRLGWALWAALMCSSVLAQTPDFPARKPGLWEARIENAQIPGGGMTSQECIDEKTDAQMQKRAFMGEGQKNNNCKLISSKKTSKGWEIDSSCKNPQLTVNAHTVVSGDMQSAYTVDSLARFDPPMMGQKEMRTQMKFRHVGACKPGMKPGDVSINGAKLSLNSGKAPSEAEIKKMIEAMKQQ